MIRELTMLIFAQQQIYSRFPIRTQTTGLLALSFLFCWFCQGLLNLFVSLFAYYLLFVNCFYFANLSNIGLKFRDIRGELFFNNELVGSTGVAKFDSNYQSWDWSADIGASSTIALRVHPSRPLTCSTMNIKLLDCSSDEVVGVVSLSGNDLDSFLNKTSSGPFKLAIEVPLIIEQKGRQSTVARRINTMRSIAVNSQEELKASALGTIDDQSLASEKEASTAASLDYVPMELDEASAEAEDNEITTQRKILKINCRRTDMLKDSTSVVDFDALSMSDSQTLDTSLQHDSTVFIASQSLSQSQNTGEEQEAKLATAFVQTLSEQIIDVSIHELRVIRPLELIGGPRDAP